MSRAWKAWFGDPEPPRLRPWARAARCLPTILLFALLGALLAHGANIFNSVCP